MSEPAPSGGPGDPARPPPRALSEPARVRFRKVRRAAPGTVLLLAALAVAFALQTWAGHGDAADPLAIFRLGGLHWVAIEAGDWWRLGSYSFLHVGLAHFLINCWALWILMRPIEGTFGPVGSLGLFSASALAGGAVSVAWAHHVGDPFVVGAGASAGIAGLLGARVGTLLRLRRDLPPAALKAEWIALLISILLNGLYAWKAATDGIPLGTDGHLGGLGAGLLLALVAPIPALPRSWPQRVAGALLLLCAFLLASMEGAAAARAVRPQPRLLRGPGFTALSPWMLVPLPGGRGEAIFPGANLLAAKVERDDVALAIAPGADALRLGDRTWVRRFRRDDQPGHGWVVLDAQDGAGRLHVAVECRLTACDGLANEAAAQLASSLRLAP